jgi:hypothetical protein
VPAGADHALFVIFKGFKDDDQLRAGRETFSGLDYSPVYTGDDTFDIGAYVDAARQISSDTICCLNTNSEIVSTGWLGKLAINLDQPLVGIVGATGSFETNRGADHRFPGFPNVHVRSNAFMMQRELMISILAKFAISNKIDAWLAESGPASLTRRVFDMGLSALIVGADGRGYSPAYWASSHTFRQGTQSNLLVHDNVTRTYEQMPWADKREASLRTWGQYLQQETLLLPA